MRLVLDTSILVAAERKNLPFDPSIIDGQKYISTITIAELLIGYYKANNELRKLKKMSYINNIQNSLECIHFGNEEARVYSLIYHELKSKGINIGPHDLMIGATAIANNCKILTLDETDFKRIPGLEVESIEEYVYIM